MRNERLRCNEEGREEGGEEEDDEEKITLMTRSGGYPYPPDFFCPSAVRT